MPQAKSRASHRRLRDVIVDYVTKNGLQVGTVLDEVESALQGLSDDFAVAVGNARAGHLRDIRRLGLSDHPDDLRQAREESQEFKRAAKGVKRLAREY